MRRNLTALTAAACLCLGFAVQSRAASTVSSTDAAFLRSTAQGANYEIAMARLAQQKASRADVKNYANTLVSDHEQLNSELHTLAQSKGVAWPSGMADAKQAKLTKLQSLSGSAFDRAFLADEIQVNTEDKSDLQRETGSKDADVKAFAQKMQAADSKHEQMGQQLQTAA